jgi:hypothetical protein
VRKLADCQAAFEQDKGSQLSGYYAIVLDGQKLLNHLLG